MSEEPLSNGGRNSVAVTMKPTIQDQIHDLRLDLRRLEPEGIAGKVLFWWLYPVKFVGDALLEATEAVVPKVTEAVVPSIPIVSFTLNLVETVAHGVFGMTARLGLVSSNGDHENVRTLSTLMSLVDLSADAKQDFVRNVYEELGKQQFLLGVNESTAKSMKSHAEEVLTMMWDGYGALFDVLRNGERYLNEADEMGRIRYLENKALLGVIQQADLDNKGEHRVDEMLMDRRTLVRSKIFQKFTMEEARYYIKFAVAAYGDNGIKSSNLDIGNGSFDWRPGDWTAARVSEHTGIPKEDLMELDVAYQGDPAQLRHFIALDRSRQKVILAIRGTYTHREVMIDFNGYSREFLCGESHAAISLMAERLWESVGDKVIQLLDENPGNELIVTGHSLGGGSTCCINLLLHNDVRMFGRKFRGFAYAAPPVYVPLSNVSKEAQTCVNYINQYDGVSFLCGDTVRHQIAMIAAVDKAGLDFVQRAKLLLGMAKPNPMLVKQIHNIQRFPLKVTKDGLPRGMAVPVIGNVWIWPEQSRKDTYTTVVADSLKMTHTGIFIHKNDFSDHLPARYEYVLNHVAH